jgi:hypothetical protein
MKREVFNQPPFDRIPSINRPSIGYPAASASVVIGKRWPSSPRKSVWADPKAIREGQQSGELPLDYLLRVMRDPNADDDRRDRMAIAADPICMRGCKRTCMLPLTVDRWSAILL